MTSNTSIIDMDQPQGTELGDGPDLSLPEDEATDSETKNVDESFSADAGANLKTDPEKNLKLILEGSPDQTEREGKSKMVQRIRVIICAIAFVVGLVLCFVEIGGSRLINQTMAITIWMAAAWLSEIIPLVVTAFFPLFLFPMFGILSSKQVSANYMNDTIFLFLSGMMMAFTLERWNLHKRFSLKILSYCGAKPGALLFGMMAATFFLSMYVSNTATSLMMVPNAIAVCESIEQSALPEFQHESQLFGTAVMLGIAYAANVGGMASLIGTPPNLVFQAQLMTIFPDSPEITFADWIGFGLPIGLVLFIVIWVYLRFLYLRNFQGEPVDRNIFANEYLAMGAWSIEQVAVALMFTLLALLWVFRKDLDFSSFTIKGWSNLFPEPGFISDATIGTTFVVMMFMTPARTSRLPVPGAVEQQDEASASMDATSSEWSTTLLDWETTKKLPYNIVFLFGGGFALADAFVKSGLSAFLGEKLGDVSISIAGQVYIMIFVMIWLTELTSNTATSNIMIPIAASIAVGAGVSPYTYMIPAALACSCAFCLPIATPPNMVVFATGRLPLSEMNKAGVFLNLICSVVILAAAFTIIPAVLSVGADDFPEWAENSAL